MSSTSNDVTGDVIVVGGGAGGITAALVLARARHRIALIDDQTHRNATVDEFHGFPTRDATAPQRFRSDALAELASYDVTILSSGVATAQNTDTNVSMTLTDGSIVHGVAVVLATGVRDELPSIDGLAPRWGKSVFNVRSATDGNTATSPSSSSTPHPEPTTSQRSYVPGHRTSPSLRPPTSQRSPATAACSATCDSATAPPSKRQPRS